MAGWRREIHERESLRAPVRSVRGKWDADRSSRRAPTQPGTCKIKKENTEHRGKDTGAKKRKKTLKGASGRHMRQTTERKNHSGRRRNHVTSTSRKQEGERKRNKKRELHAKATATGQRADKPGRKPLQTEPKGNWKCRRRGDQRDPRANGIRNERRTRRRREKGIKKQERALISRGRRGPKRKEQEKQEEMSNEQRTEGQAKPGDATGRPAAAHKCKPEPPPITRKGRSRVEEPPRTEQAVRTGRRRSRCSRGSAKSNRGLAEGQRWDGPTKRAPLAHRRKEQRAPKAQERRRNLQQRKPKTAKQLMITLRKKNAEKGVRNKGARVRDSSEATDLGTQPGQKQGQREEKGTCTKQTTHKKKGKGI